MIEHELKFTLTASMAAEFEQRAAMGLAQSSGRFQVRYFDTPAGDLTNGSTSLRVGQTPTGRVQTLEGPGDRPFERRTWTHPVSGELPELDALPPEDHPAARLARSCLGLLLPVFEAAYDRQVRLVRPQPDLRVGIVCDRGELRAGDRVQRIEEVTLEHEEGPAAAFYHYAAQWAGMHGAQLQFESMHLRGLRLAGWSIAAPRAGGAAPAEPPADAAIPEAARQILGSRLDHLVAAIPPVLAGTHPAGPHQLRVALKRFRAAIRFFDLASVDGAGDGAEEGPAAGAGQVPAWRDLDQSARSLADAAAPVRDADVLEHGVLARLNRAFPRDAALNQLGRALEQAREHEREHLRAVVASAGTTAFILRAHAALGTLARHRWPDGTFGDLAAARLARLARRARRRTRRARTDADWHDARMALRNLRDALEGCRGLAAAGEPVAEAIAVLSRWQEKLGAAQDLATAPAAVARALAHGQVPAALAVRAVGLVDGYRAFAARARPPRKLRRPILDGLERLLAPIAMAGREPGYHSRHAGAQAPTDS